MVTYFLGSIVVIAITLLLYCLWHFISETLPRTPVPDPSVDSPEPDKSRILPMPQPGLRMREVKIAANGGPSRAAVHACFDSRTDRCS
jgi:hypothetical protein